MNLSSALLIAMVSLGASSKTPYDTTKSGKKPDTTHAQQRGFDSLPLTVKLVKTDDAKQQAAQDSIRVEVERGIAVSTLRWTKVAGVAAVFLALFALGTWDVMRRSSQRQLRAYLGFSNRWFDGIKDRIIAKGNFADGRPTMGIFVNNHGQTPATKVRFRGGCEVFSESEAEARIAAVLNPPWTPSDKPPRVCDPRLGEALPLYYRMVGSVAETINAAKKEHLYVFARVQYRDIFGKTHTSTLCTFWAPEYIEEVGDNWSHAPHHNTAD